MRHTMELARVGIFGEQKQVVTEKDLKEMVKTFNGKVPIGLGHKTTDWLPALGWVHGISYSDSDKMLYGDVEFNDLLQDAVDRNLYKSWSIRAPYDVNGERHLQHVAMNGDMPSAIKDLKILEGRMINMADGGNEALEIPTTDGKITRTKKEEQKMAEEKKVDPQGQPAAGGGSPAPSQQDIKLADEVAGLKKDNEVMLKQIRSANKAALAQAIAGKVPAAKHNLVLQLADQLPLGETIELADDKGNKSKVSVFDLLMKIFEAIPAPVKTGMMEMGDLPGGDKDGKPVNYQAMAAKF